MRQHLSLIALSLIPLATIGAMHLEQPTEQHRLVGLGCGPDRLTFTAVEEDHFPKCDTIDTPRNLCGHDDAAACALYLGDGW